MAWKGTIDAVSASVVGLYHWIPPHPPALDASTDNYGITGLLRSLDYAFEYAEATEDLSSPPDA
jgi:hypothetical protein